MDGVRWRLVGAVMVCAVLAVPAAARADMSLTLAGQVSSAALGDPLSDRATLAGAYTEASGTIGFRLYGPGDAACTAAPLFTASVPVHGNGDYDSPAYTPAHAGVYRWTAEYSGGGDSVPISAPCSAPATVARATPSLSATAGDGLVGEPAGAHATLNGGHGAAGTLTFRAWTTADCSGAPAFAGAPVAVAGDGGYDSPRFTPSAAGDYRWIASYSGDVDNAPAQTACGVPTSGISARVVIAAERTTTPRLELSGVSATRCANAGGSIGVRYAVGGAAKVTLTLQRRVKPEPAPRFRCPGKLSPNTRHVTWRGVKVAAQGLPAAGGAHRFRLGSALRTAKLAPGRYRVLIQATSASGAKLRATAWFWVLTLRR